MSKAVSTLSLLSYLTLASVEDNVLSLERSRKQQLVNTVLALAVLSAAHVTRKSLGVSACPIYGVLAEALACSDIRVLCPGRYLGFRHVRTRQGIEIKEGIVLLCDDLIFKS